ncbi:MAG: hypothetical protein LPK80_10135 [Bacteroidota bacterium]|nr:hypothetical protein [Bacteroidota bacterium]
MIQRLVIFFLFTWTPLFAFHPDSLFTKANEAYQKGEFSEAVEYYRTIQDSGYASAELFYNLGNAYYRSGRLGYGILNLERALVMDPKMQDARTNLELLESKRVDHFDVVPPSFGDRVRTWMHRNLSPALLFPLSVLSSILGMVLLWIFYRTGRSRGNFLILSVITMGVGLLTFLGWSWRERYDSEQHWGVVVSGNTYVKSEPGESRTDLFILHEGTKARILEVNDGWMEVRLPDGKQGWVSENDFEEI